MFSNTLHSASHRPWLLQERSNFKPNRTKVHLRPAGGPASGARPTGGWAHVGPPSRVLDTHRLTVLSSFHHLTDGALPPAIRHVHDWVASNSAIAGWRAFTRATAPPRRTDRRFQAGHSHNPIEIPDDEDD